MGRRRRETHAEKNKTKQAKAAEEDVEEDMFWTRRVTAANPKTRHKFVLPLR